MIICLKIEGFKRKQVLQLHLIVETVCDCEKKERRTKQYMVARNFKTRQLSCFKQQTYKTKQKRKTKHMGKHNDISENKFQL